MVFIGPFRDLNRKGMHADLVEVNSQAKPVAAPRTHAVLADAAPTPAKRLLSRRQLLAGVFPIAALASTGAYATQVEPFWVDYHDHPMPLRNLPPAFAGFR